MTKGYLYYKELLEDTPFPYAVLDVDIFQKNIQHNLERAHPKKIRIASKSLRCRRAMEIILESSGQFQGIMTYHGRELIQLADWGFDDLLMGYPICDPKLLNRIAELIKKGKQVCLMVDHPHHLDLLEEVGRRMDVRIPICLDLDMSTDYPGLRFGVWRSQIMHSQDLEAILTQIGQLKFIRLEGVMGYEAQIAGVPDSHPTQSLKNPIIRWLKNRSVRQVQTRRQKAVNLIIQAGFTLRFVNGGGTGSVETTRQEECVTEITVGSGFYVPHLFDHYRHFTLQPALFYAIPVVRKPSSKIFTCHGGGYLASGPADQLRLPVVYLPNHGKLDRLEGAGEVQTPIRFKHLQDELQIGDPIFLRHAKAGELCEHFNELIFLSGKERKTYPTYRGEGLAFG